VIVTCLPDSDFSLVAEAEAEMVLPVWRLDLSPSGLTRQNKSVPLTAAKRTCRNLMGRDSRPEARLPNVVTGTQHAVLSCIVLLVLAA